MFAMRLALYDRKSRIAAPAAVALRSWMHDHG
jgi:hypothetical protein